MSTALQAPQHRQLVEGDIVADRYRLQKLQAAGGSADLWLALDERLDRPVAIKLLRDGNEEAGTVSDEGRLLAKLSHPNILAVYDEGTFSGRRFFAFEFLQGKTLRELLDESGALPLAEAVPLFLAVADALAFAHEKDVVHGDLKPENIIRPEAGPVRLVDFGIAHRLVTVSPAEARAVAGTMAYIAPEVIQGEALSTAADIYSLALTLLEALLGSYPFGSTSDPAGALARRLTGTGPELGDGLTHVPPGLHELLSRSLSSDPRSRPTATAFRANLAGLRHLTSRIDQSPGTAVATSQAMSETPRTRGLVAVAGAVAGLVLLGAVAAVLVSNDDAEGGPSSASPTAPAFADATPATAIAAASTPSNTGPTKAAASPFRAAASPTKEKPGKGKGRE